MAITAWYNPRKILSLNCRYNFIVGPRGNGKTYGFKKKCIKDALRHGKQFIYLRRWKPEIQAASASFFSDIAHEFPDYDFRSNGKYAEASLKLRDGQDEKKRKWKRLGYFLALSISGNIRSVSFHEVWNVMFDEFIAPEFKYPKYLPSEWKAFLELYNTIDRNRGQARVYFISNSVTIMNPYFIALDIRPDQMDAITTMGHNPLTGVPFVAIELVSSTAFTDEVNQTAFGQWLMQVDPEYADYAIGNEFKDAHEKLVGEKTQKSEYLLTIETIKHGKFSVWHDYRERNYFVQTGLPKVEKVYTLDRNRMDEGKRFIENSDPLLTRLRKAFNNAQIIFDRPSTRNAFAEIFDKK